MARAKSKKTTTKKKSSGVAEGYLHGYTKKEQQRLYKQARFLEPSVFHHVDFEKKREILEVGCGVGAQTEILLRRFPKLKIHGIDASKAQIQTAKKHLAKQVREGRVVLQLADALHLPFDENAFDGAFVCWFLEHVQNPVEILREIRRTLKAKGVIYCSEVLNSTFFVHPYSPATLQYWFAFNDHQWNLGGDPFVGGKLANYLLEAGFQNIKTTVTVHHYDNRTPKQRAQFIEYWINLLLSGAPSLIQAGKTTVEVVEQMKMELSKLKDDPNAVFFYSWVQARAEAY